MDFESSPVKRSLTRNHTLLPASKPGSAFEVIPKVPSYSFISWTLGRGSVIWRIWPAVLLHTLFAAAVVTLSLQHILDLEIPNVMLTVLGVVIGFVISYRAISGYDRYWMGRTCWSDIVRNSRTLGRLVWYHVPPRFSPKTPEETAAGELKRSTEEMNKVMAEKRMALDLIEGFSVALKHHIRGELGIYYEDLYHLIRPMHDHDHSVDSNVTQAALSSTLPSPRKGHHITKEPGMPRPKAATMPSVSGHHAASTSHTLIDIDDDIDYEEEDDDDEGSSSDILTKDPVIPSINDYGTFDPNKLYTDNGNGSSKARKRKLRHSRSHDSHFSGTSQHRPLLPGSRPPADDTVMHKISGDLIPFAGFFTMIKEFFVPSKPCANVGQEQQIDPSEPPRRQWGGPVQSTLHVKHRPRVAGGGENLPLEILRCLSEWFSVLEDRATVTGMSMGPMIGTLAAFEDNLSSLEKILTTPLPFVYSVHIRHTVWLYLFFLPFQLVNQFNYYTIPGVAIASFIYLGFLAAGEEIEQPFGYDDNDLDLDLICHAIIHQDIKHLKISPCLNAFFDPKLTQHPRPPTHPKRSMTLTSLSGIDIIPADEFEQTHGNGKAPILGHPSPHIATSIVDESQFVFGA